MHVHLRILLGMWSDREAKIEDYGSYWCEAKVEGTSVLSEIARIELADNETEYLGSTWEQREGISSLSIFSLKYCYSLSSGTHIQDQ